MNPTFFDKIKRAKSINKSYTDVHPKPFSMFPNETTKYVTLLKTIQKVDDDQSLFYKFFLGGGGVWTYILPTKMGIIPMIEEYLFTW